LVPLQWTDELTGASGETSMVGPLADTETARLGVEPAFHLTADPSRAEEATASIGDGRRSLAQKVRRWFRRVA